MGPLRNDRLLARLADLLAAQNVEAYLVGGAVRDLLLGWKLKDYDFVVGGDALALARRLADEVGGAFVPLDVERNVGRIVLRPADQTGDAELDSPTRAPISVDLAGLRGSDIHADLLDRDFTVNAMAIDIRRLDGDPLRVIDPGGGLADLQTRTVRALAENSLRNDPLRLMRAVRVAAQIGGDIEAQTQKWIRRDAPLLSQPSPERVRDELARMLSLPGSADQIRSMDEFGLLDMILPELSPMHGVAQSPPHVYDVFDHSLLAVAEMEQVTRAVFAEDQVFLGPVVEYAEAMAGYLDETPAADRSHAALLELVMLFHDSGKPATRTVESDGRLRFIGHPEVSVSLASRAVHRLKFSTRESQFVETAVRHHMRPLLLGTAAQVSRRAVYRFFRDTGIAGLGILLLSLADFRATRGPTLTGEAWQHRLAVVRVYLDRYFPQHAEVVAPPKLIDGHDLAELFALAPGPQYRVLLEAVREAQAEGIIADRAEALALVDGLLDDPSALAAVAASHMADLEQEE